MDKFLALINNSAITKSVEDEIIKCNEKTAMYGLKLSSENVKTLINTRKEALASNGRVEFSAGIIKKFIEEFCDSPYISQYNYLDTIDGLIEIFYYYKNETLDFIGDDELIEKMKEYFNGSCEGSLELLQNRELCKVEYNVKHGIHDYFNISDDGEDENEEY